MSHIYGDPVPQQATLYRSNPSRRQSRNRRSNYATNARRKSC
jgi:hypothetical protein